MVRKVVSSQKIPTTPWAISYPYAAILYPKLLNFLEVRRPKVQIIGKMKERRMDPAP